MMEPPEETIKLVEATTGEEAEVTRQDMATLLGIDEDDEAGQDILSGFFGFSVTTEEEGETP